MQKAYRVDFNGSSKKISAIKNSPKHLLGIQNLSILEAKRILNEAKAASVDHDPRQLDREKSLLITSVRIYTSQKKQLRKTLLIF